MKTFKKISQRQKRSISKKSSDLNDAILKLKEKIKRDPVVIEKFKEYNVPLDKIDSIDVSFCPLDVSAKTKDKKIYLNIKLFGSDAQAEHYLVHELVHYLQQSTGSLTKEDMSDDYLDRPAEEEAFSAQIDYKEEHESPEEAERYVDNLLDYHGVKGKDREEKKKDLL